MPAGPDVREPVCIWPAGAQLCEGPFWDDRANALYWVDIKAPCIMRWTQGGERRVWKVPAEIGCLAPRAAGGMIAALRTGIALWDPDTDRFEPVCNPEQDRSGNRFNDGKCDQSGNFWAGSMDDAILAPTGWLYRLDKDRRLVRTEGGYVVTNGPAFSPDGRSAYHTDTMGRTVYAYDLLEGVLSNKRVFVRFSEADGYPDGMTVDAEGCVWICHWGGGRVTRHRADGTRELSIAMPATQVTSCAFGGKSLSTLFVTTAAIGLPPEERARQPLAGGLFAVETEFKGVPVARYAG
ncbi:MAG: SMP-30/gluconolactonase/LRE family protein [Rhodospirillales bacterium]|nr:SMP-30/gluconolactonase/LRE family protein [Rhodospirillales bacterium]